MSKYFAFSFVLLALSGCVSQTVPKKPPLVAHNQKAWVAVNADDFVPPKAKTYARVQEINLEADLEQVKIKPAGE